MLLLAIMLRRATERSVVKKFAMPLELVLPLQRLVMNNTCRYVVILALLDKVVQEVLVHRRLRFQFSRRAHVGTDSPFPFGYHRVIVIRKRFRRRRGVHLKHRARHRIYERLSNSFEILAHPPMYAYVRVFFPHTFCLDEFYMSSV